MFLIVIFLPLLAFLVTFFTGRFLNRKHVLLIHVFMNFLCLGLSSIVLLDVMYIGGYCEIDLGVWIDIDIVKINWLFLFDSITVLLLWMVVLISFLVHIYSLDYMLEDPFFFTIL